MNNYDYPPGADNDSSAPWNQIDTLCPICKEPMTIIDSGSFRGIVWNEYKCYDCDYSFTEEPDYD